MVKELKQRIITILTIIIWLFLVFFLVTVVGYNYITLENEYQQMSGEAQKLMTYLSRRGFDEESVDKVTEELRDYRNVYAVYINDKGEIEQYLYSNKYYEEVRTVVDIIWNSEEIKNIRDRALDENYVKFNNTKGETDDYWFKFKKVKDSYILTFYMKSAIISQLRSLIMISAVVTIIGAGLSFMLALIITRIIIRPVEEGYQRQKSFIADASHELKTPLAVINVNIDMLQKGVNTEKYLRYIKQECNKMDLLVKELLLLASVENEQQLEFCMLDLSDVMEGASQPFEAIAYEEGITFNMDIEEGIYFKGDQVKLQRLAGIFIDNAIKHADFDKIVDVSLKREGKNIIFSVSNTGKVIPKEIQKKIFERFYREDKSRSRNEGRFGLGLAIAKVIVTQHKGRIYLKSENNRTVFWVKL